MFPLGLSSEWEVKEMSMNFGDETDATSQNEGVQCRSSNHSKSTQNLSSNTFQHDASYMMVPGRHSKNSKVNTNYDKFWNQCSSDKSDAETSYISVDSSTSAHEDEVNYRKRRMSSSGLYTGIRRRNSCRRCGDGGRSRSHKSLNQRKKTLRNVASADIDTLRSSCRRCKGSRHRKGSYGSAKRRAAFRNLVPAATVEDLYAAGCGTDRELPIMSTFRGNSPEDHRHSSIHPTNFSHNPEYSYNKSFLYKTLRWLTYRRRRGSLQPITHADVHNSSHVFSNSLSRAHTSNGIEYCAPVIETTSSNVYTHEPGANHQNSIPRGLMRVEDTSVATSPTPISFQTLNQNQPHCLLHPERRSIHKDPIYEEPVGLFTMDYRYPPEASTSQKNYSPLDALSARDQFNHTPTLRRVPFQMFDK